MAEYVCEVVRPWIEGCMAGWICVQQGGAGRVSVAAEWFRVVEWGLQAWLYVLRGYGLHGRG